MADIAYPRQAVIVSCRGNTKRAFSNEIEERDNLITLSWHMPVSFDPELYAISVGKERFSHKLIEESGVFAVNFLPYHLKDEALFCGRNSGEHIDKFEKTKLKKEEAESIDCCRILNAAGIMECEVIDSKEAGDHTIFIGKVLKKIDKKGGKKLFQAGGDGFTTTK